MIHLLCLRPPTAEPACLQLPPLHSPILFENKEGAAVRRLLTETYWYNSKLKYTLDLSMNSQSGLQVVHCNYRILKSLSSD